MKLSDYFTEIPHMFDSSSIYDVCEWFRKHPQYPTLPVVNENIVPIGTIHEYDLKEYVYGMYGQALIKRHALVEFLRPFAQIELNSGTEELLKLSSGKERLDGVIVTESGRYKGIILLPALLQIYEKHRMDSQMRLSQVQKMEAIGTLAGGIAHDFNNILTPILGYADLIQSSLMAKEPVSPEYLDEIIRAGNRARILVEQILNFSRKKQSECIPVGLSGIIEEVLKLLRATIPANICISTEFNTTEDTILAEPTEIYQIIMNLCTNAYHVMRESGGVLTVSLSEHSGALPGWSEHDDILLAGYFRISVKDSGSGIPQTELPRIFEPFFTTKKPGEGTGMGLSLVHGIVKRYQGFISVESGCKSGSTFHVYLPQLNVFENLHHSDRDLPVAAIAADCKCSVLYVDDEIAITNLAREAFALHGIEITVRNDSSQALALFADDPAKYNIVITDQAMPGITGVNLARHLLEMRPDLPIVLCSGYSDIISPENVRQIGIREYIPKPIDFRKMLRVICSLAADVRGPLLCSM